MHFYKNTGQVRAQDDRVGNSIEKHSCPSGLRGPSQERLSRDAWVRTPPDAFLRKRISGRGIDIKGGCSSNGRAFASHVKGKGIDTPHLHSNFKWYDSIVS